uniref:Guanine nucleotide exchange factor DBS-like n=1 Tax=Phallusia mammillata TaxID=59560 RepID=A0A6F9DL42_9ASCI|nr:guanine nucleotide exchange factor DBS-like [Phallusia mammillata]
MMDYDVTETKHVASRCVSAATKGTPMQSNSCPDFQTILGTAFAARERSKSYNDIGDVGRPCFLNALKSLDRDSVGRCLKPILTNRRNAIDFSPMDAACDDVFEEENSETSSFEAEGLNAENGDYWSNTRDLSESSGFHATPTESRKLPDEMLSYYTFLQCCTALQSFANGRQVLSPTSSLSDSLESLTFPSALPSSPEISAQKLSHQLSCCYAFMHGGRDVSEAPIICLPHYPQLRDVTNEDFNSVILYLTTIVSACIADVGFVLLIDRRKEKWSALRATLQRFASYFPGFIRMVLVLRPIGFLQGAMSDIGFRWQRDELSMKVTMLSGLDELYNYINPSQLPAEFGGSFQYDHQTFIKNRMMIESFTGDAISFSESLIKYGTELAETEMPNDISSTESLLHVQNSKTTSLKQQIENLMKEAVALRVNVTSSCGGSIIADSMHNESDFLKSSLMDALKSFLSLIEETDVAFEKFWERHVTKLKQCLQLRQFEQDYRDLRGSLEGNLQWIEEQTQNVGSSVEWIEAMMTELETKQNNLKNLLNRNATVVASGETLLGDEHYAVDSIGPKKDELQSVGTQLVKLFAQREKCLHQSLIFILERNKWSEWCEQGMSILAGQLVEKTTSVDGAEQALNDLQRFFKEEGSPYSGKQHNDLKTEFDAAWCPEFEGMFESLLHRFEEVTQLCEKRKSSLKKITTRHGDRPVQLVEPSKKVVKEVQQSARVSPKPNQSEEKQTKRNSLILNHGASPVHTNRVPEDTPPPHPESHTVKQQHVMNELLHTEKVYVAELESIVEGYGKAIDAQDPDYPVPEELKGKTRILLGNMEDIFNFHGNVFLTDLLESKDTPTKIGKCFIQQKEQFHIYRDYCQNSIKSEQLRTRVGDHHPFFLHCQKKLGHRLSLGAYLLKPIQRLTKYQLLLQQMLKHTTSKDSDELKQAIQSMLEILKSVNDSMHQIAIVGFPREVDNLGKLLMQGSFSVQVDHKKAGVKSLTRPRFSKAMHRHLFLYEKEFLFCKQQTAESLESDSSNTVPSSTSSQSNGTKGQVYLFKHSLQMNAVGVTENIKADPRKFEIWYHGREDVYTLAAPTASIKQEWVREVKKALSCQPKSTTTPPEPRKPEEKVPGKVKRNQSTKKSKTPDGTEDHAKTKSKSSSTSSAKETLKKKASSLTRSASMGKGKDKILRRKNMDVVTNSSAQKKNETSAVTQNNSQKTERIPSPEHLKPSIVVENDFTTEFLKDRPTLSNGQLDSRMVGEDLIETAEDGKGDESDTWTSSNHVTSVSDASSFESFTSVDALP